MNWFRRFFVDPKFCPECGSALVKNIRPGTGVWAGEDWAFLECPNHKPYDQHYSKFFQTLKRKPKFDPYSGKSRGD